MILTGSEIWLNVKSKKIVIEPFFEGFLNPNSYNYHLGSCLKIAPPDTNDPNESNHWPEINIPEVGFLLEPSKLYLGHTLEKIGSNYFVTSLIGRSSVGRLGLYLQLAADLGQLGAIHCWTLEMYVIQPLRVFAGMVIGQVSFWVPTGDILLYYGRYEVNKPLENQLYLKENEENQQYDPHWS
jgi:dCTP deaminase